MNAFTLFLVSLILLGCATSPTGRKQVHLVDEGQMAKLGSQSFDEIKRKTPPSRDAGKVRLVNCVVNALLERNGFNTAEWEVRVFQDPQVNAFALPGKKIGVFEGIFKTAKTPDQLAAVLGHEIGHVRAEHGNERVSQQLLIQAGLSLADLMVDGRTQKGKTLMAALGVGAMFGVALPFSREHELEADKLGLQYMAQAGFDPNDAVVLWQNMSALGKAQPEFLSTHPDPKTRIQKIEREIPKVLPVQQQSVATFGAPECQ